MEKIVYSKSFILQLNELIEVLYNEEYFGFEESAIEYVLKIYDFIENSIEYSVIRKTPFDLEKKGKFYMAYNANKNTTWYILFDKKDDKYIVNLILNNHTKDSEYFNR